MCDAHDDYERELDDEDDGAEDYEEEDLNRSVSDMVACVCCASVCCVRLSRAFAACVCCVRLLRAFVACVCRVRSLRLLRSLRAFDA